MRTGIQGGSPRTPDGILTPRNLQRPRFKLGPISFQDDSSTSSGDETPYRQSAREEKGRKAPIPLPTLTSMELVDQPCLSGHSQLDYSHAPFDSGAQPSPVRSSPAPSMNEIQSSHEDNISRSEDDLASNTGSSPGSRSSTPFFDSVHDRRCASIVDETATPEKPIDRSLDDAILNFNGMSITDGPRGEESLDESVEFPDKVDINGRQVTAKFNDRESWGEEAEGEWRPTNGSKFWQLDALKKGGTPFSLPAKLYKRMYPHQREGVAWLWGLHQGAMGGILGDDMGLGKTFQVACFLAGLFHTRQATSALVLAPVSVIRTWEAELQQWLVSKYTPFIEVKVLTSTTKAAARKSLLYRAVGGGSGRAGSVVVASYGLVASNPAVFAPRGRERPWDYVFLDEGHKIKNTSTKISCAVHSLPTKHRLIITGTPIQNCLKELWALVNWSTFGKLLDKDYRTFKQRYEVVIDRGQDRDATPWDVERSRLLADELRVLLAPHLLQRKKADLTCGAALGGAGAGAGSLDRGGGARYEKMGDAGVDALLGKMPSKTELVLWVDLSEHQRHIYQEYLEGGRVKDVLTQEVSSPLAAITHLKQICAHPLVAEPTPNSGWSLDANTDTTDLVSGSTKLEVLLALLENLWIEGHRSLVFSQSVRMLDIIEQCLVDRALRSIRIDGSHNDRERQDTINTFNRSSNVGGDIAVCLLSTRVGGYGITLTGADRVVVFDPSWNPAEDRQAVDRAYRIGQRRDVVVYRMIAAGTVEEKMYEKQVYKDGLRKTVMGEQEDGLGRKGGGTRLFSWKELRQLFTLGEKGVCQVLDMLEALSGKLEETLIASSCDAHGDLVESGHLDFLRSMEGVEGISAHGEALPGKTKSVNCRSTMRKLADSRVQEEDVEVFPRPDKEDKRGGRDRRASLQNDGEDEPLFGRMPLVSDIESSDTDKDSFEIDITPQHDSPAPNSKALSEGAPSQSLPGGSEPSGVICPVASPRSPVLPDLHEESPYADQNSNANTCGPPTREVDPPTTSTSLSGEATPRTEGVSAARDRAKKWAMETLNLGQNFGPGEDGCLSEGCYEAGRPGMGGREPLRERTGQPSPDQGDMYSLDRASQGDSSPQTGTLSSCSGYATATDTVVAGDGSPTRDVENLSPLKLMSGEKQAGRGSNLGPGGDRGGLGQGDGRACSTHAAYAVKRGFKCMHCRCFAGKEAQLRAAELTSEARVKEDKGEIYAAMSACLEAGRLCDDDQELHRMITRLAGRLGFGRNIQG